jgi:hypothetical protein
MGGKKQRLYPGDVFYPTDQEIEVLGNDIRPVGEKPRPKRRRAAPTTTPEDQAPTQENETSNEEETAGEPADEGVQEPVHVGGGFYELPDGRRIRGKENALDAMTAPEEE